MKTFNYTAINGKGETVTGQIEAESEKEAITKIREMGLFPNQITEETPREISDVPSTDTEGATSEVTSFPGESLHLKRLLAQRAETADRHLAWKNLGTLLQCGVPILQALKITRSSTTQKKNYDLVTQVHKNVTEGESICISLAGRVPVLELAIISVGEEIGALPETLLKITEVDTDLLEDDYEFVISNLLPPMMEAGLPLLRCLYIVANLFKDKPNSKLGKIVEELAEKIKQGYTFSEALEERPDVFTKFFVNVIRAGELGGFLEVALRRIKDYIFDAYKRNGLVH